MNRAIGFILALTWIVAMAALVQRDILPLWTATEAPDQLLPIGEYQVGIFSQSGARIGTTWITTNTTPTRMVRSTTVLETGKISAMLPVIGTWILSTDLSYDSQDRLEHFKFLLNAPGILGEVDAERIERDFSVIAKLGDIKKTMLLDGELSKYLSETLRPFTHLGRMRLGQSWRIRLLDPFALIKSQTVEFQTLIARVSSMDTIRHQGRDVECFRVETPSSRAWADHSGRVLKQEVQLPLIGRWTLMDEPVDAKSRHKAVPSRKQMRSDKKQ